MSLPRTSYLGSIKQQLPNALTLARLFFSIIVFILLVQGQYVLSFGLFCLAIISDWLDGYLARLWKVGSRFGERYDPLVDKFLVLLPLAFFTYQYAISFLYFLVIFARESVITLVREKMYNKGGKMPADIYGKIKTNLQFGLVILFFVITLWFSHVDTIFLTLVYFFVSTWTAWSGFNYLQKLQTTKRK